MRSEGEMESKRPEKLAKTGVKLTKSDPKVSKTGEN